MARNRFTLGWRIGAIAFTSALLLTWAVRAVPLHAAAPLGTPQFSDDELAALINETPEQIDAAVRLLRNLKQHEAIRDHCKRLQQFEHDGDQIFRAKIGEMFRTEKDAVHLLKHKEFLEGLENTLDACDDVANALEALVIKNA